MNANMPAYPRTGVGNAGTMFDVPPQDGLTKRELIAAMCLQGLLAGNGAHISAEIVAIQYADALLAQLAKEQT